MDFKIMAMNDISSVLKKFFTYRFNLQEDSAPQAETITSIKKNVAFKGANLWTLIFAIFVACIGLNVNSTAVIIGAMLISPLMGPIVGIGLGIGTNDFDLVKKGLRNLTLATIISIIASTLYFTFTPLHEASSELLARTSPSIWDVFIATLGGLAGIVAASRKEKSNVIPGVAIATALMPPLCTAGFGIATGNLYYFMGAIYLYFINSVFICVSTFLIVRFLKFKKKTFENKEDEQKVTRYIWIIVIITIAPSVYLTYQIVGKSIFENNANRFITQQLNYTNTQVISKNLKYNRKGSEIDLLLLGAELSPQQLDSLNQQLPDYQLKGTKLLIRQGLNAKNEVDLSQIKASILEDVFKSNTEAATRNDHLSVLIPDLSPELRVLYPDLKNYSITNAVFNHLDSNKHDTLTMVVANFYKPIPVADQDRLRLWLKRRIKVDSLKLIVQ